MDFAKAFDKVCYSLLQHSITTAFRVKKAKLSPQAE